MKMSVIGRRGSKVLAYLAPRRSFTTSVSQQPWPAQASAQQAPPRADNDFLHLAIAILGLTLSAYCSKHFMSQPTVNSFKAAPVVSPVVWTESVGQDIKPVEAS